MMPFSLQYYAIFTLWFYKKIKIQVFYILFLPFFPAVFLIFFVRNRKEKIRVFVFWLAFIYGLDICRDIYLEFFDEKKDNSLAT